MNVASRMDAYLTNMKMPWEKEAPPTLLSVGALECWAQTSESEYKFERLWSKTFPKQAICLYWDATSSSLFVGLDEGKLSCLKIPADSNFIRYEEVRLLISSFGIFSKQKGSSHAPAAPGCRVQAHRGGFLHSSARRSSVAGKSRCPRDPVLAILRSLHISEQFIFSLIFQQFEKQVHDERIMGIYYDNISGIIYTVGEDKAFKTIQKNEVTNCKIFRLSRASRYQRLGWIFA